MVRNGIAAGALAVALALQGNAQGAFIPITNAGFESPPTATFTPGALGGWTITGSGAGVWNINDAPLGFWNVSAPEGKQVAFVGREDPPGTPASIIQELGSTLQDNSLYTFSGMVGHPLGFGTTPDPDTAYTIELLAGNNVLGSITGTGPEGSFVPFLLTFDSTGSSFVGEFLQLRLSSSQTQTAFDALALEVSALSANVPEPSTLVIGTTLGVAFLAARQPQKHRRNKTRG